MNGLYEFPPHLRSAVESAMAPGEVVAWAGRPCPRAAFLSMLPVWLFAIPWLTASSLFFGSAIAAAAGMAVIEGAEGPMAWVMLIFSLPFMAVGIGALSAPLFAMREAQNSGFLITDRRVLKVTATRNRMTRSLTGAALRGVESRVGSDGRGAVKVLGPVGKDSDGDRVADDIKMIGVADAAGAEAALWRLIDRTRMGSPV